MHAGGPLQFGLHTMYPSEAGAVEEHMPLAGGSQRTQVMLSPDGITMNGDEQVMVPSALQDEYPSIGGWHKQS